MLHKHKPRVGNFPIEIIRMAVSMSLIIVVSLIVGLSVAAVYGLVVLIRRLKPDTTPIRGTTDIEGFYITVLGALYAIFVAFMIFTVWTRYYEAVVVVNQEANELADVYRLSEALPQPLQDQMQKAAMDYADIVVKYDWPAMAQGEIPDRMQTHIDRMWKIMNSIGPEQVPDEVRRDHLGEAFDSLMDYRRLRILHSQTSLPGLLYTVLIFGAVLVIGFAVLFTVEGFWPHVIKACVLAAIISLMVFTVWALDHPFQSWVHVSSQPFERVLELDG